MLILQVYNGNGQYTNYQLRAKNLSRYGDRLPTHVNYGNMLPRHFELFLDMVNVSMPYATIGYLTPLITHGLCLCCGALEYAHTTMIYPELIGK
jgi:hypothetical protein